MHWKFIENKIIEFHEWWNTAAAMGSMRNRNIVTCTYIYIYIYIFFFFGLFLSGVEIVHFYEVLVFACGKSFTNQIKKNNKKFEEEDA